jgi:hypothetical protein
LTTVVRLVVSDSLHALERRHNEMEKLAAEIKADGARAMPLVVVGSDPSQMVATVLQSAGVGPMQVNTAVANWPQADAAFYQPLGIDDFGSHVGMAFRVGTNLILLDADDAAWERLQALRPSERVIDVWWRDTRTGELMLLLAYLMRRSKEWRQARIRLIAAPDEGEAPDAWRAALQAQIDSIRIPAEILPVADRSQATVVSTSHASAMVFMPFSIHGGRFYSPFGWKIDTALPRLPITALVLAAQDVDLEAEPDHDVDIEAGSESAV